MIEKELKLSTIKKIHQRLSSYVVETPLISAWNLFNEEFQTELFLKLEFFQNSGTFKVRGAINNILNLDNNSKKKGITAVSAGNHAIAAAYAANKFGLKNKIFIYSSANHFRINKCKELKANLNFTDPHSAFSDVKNASTKEGYYYIHPFDGVKTIQGTASLGYEICKQVNHIDNIIVSVGGGGLIAGIGSIIKQLFPKCKVFGVEPEGAKGLSDSLISGQPMENVSINTISDSLSAPLHMPYSFSICKKVIDEMVTVTDLEMINAMNYMYSKCKMLLEPACVAGIAALAGPLKGKLFNQKTLVVLCGSNIDVHTWHDLINNKL